MSPLMNPMSTSLTFGEGEVRFPPCRSRPLDGGEPYVVRWDAVDCASKRGSIVRGCFVTVGSAGRGFRHSSSQAAANTASNVLKGSRRLL